MDTHNVPYTYNLKWNEEKTGPIIDILLSNIGYGYYFDAFKLSTSTFTPLLELIDKSSTADHITFLPLDYLKTLFPDAPKIEDPFKEKEYLYSLLLSSKELCKRVLKDEYLGIPIRFLKKPILVCDIIENTNFSNLDDINDLVTYRNAWFDNLTINDIMARLCYLNPKLKIRYVETLILDADWDEYSMCKEINFYLKSVTEVDLILVPVIYYEHFTIFIIDLRLKIVSFYDSGGYEPDGIFKNSDLIYIFINDNMSYSKYDTKKYRNLKSPYPRYFYINCVLTVVNNLFGINTGLFNSFKQQFSKTECGAFIISFCLHYIHLNPENKTNIKYVYNALVMKGDLMMTYLRSCFFINADDLHQYKLSHNDYTKYLGILKINNKYYNKYLQIYNNELNIFNKIVENLTKSRKEFLSVNTYNENLDEYLNNL